MREARLLGHRSSVSLLCACWFCFACALVARGGQPAELSAGIFAEISTPRGTLWAELFFERAPLTVANFVGLAEGKLGPKPGVPFYNGLAFHRVVPGFVVQGGDPGGTGEGGPGYILPDEFDPSLTHDAAGMLSMANEGPDTNGSQFFITLAALRRLDFLHSVFGRVTQGLEVLPRIRQGDRMTILIHRVGERAQAFATDRAAIERLSAVKLKYSENPDALFFGDAEGLLPANPPRSRNFNYKLANVARATGQRIFGRIVSGNGLSAAGRDERARELATTLGLQRRGVLAVYFASSDAWEILVGTEDAEKYLGSSDPSVLAEMERVWLRDAARATAQWETEAENITHDLDAKQRIKLKVDGVLNELIHAFVQSSVSK